MLGSTTSLLSLLSMAKPTLTCLTMSQSQRPSYLTSHRRSSRAQPCQTRLPCSFTGTKWPTNRSPHPAICLRWRLMVARSSQLSTMVTTYRKARLICRQTSSLTASFSSDSTPLTLTAGHPLQTFLPSTCARLLKACRLLTRSAHSLIPWSLPGLTPLITVDVQ